MDLLPDGSRRRRAGLVITPSTGFDLGSTGVTGTYSFTWDVSDGTQILAVAIGEESSLVDTLWFFTTTPNYTVLGTVYNVFKGKYCTIKDKLYVAVGETPNPDLPDGIVKELTYSAGSVAISAEGRLQVRDIWGMETDIPVDFRPPLVPATDGKTRHMYNLRNQGWPLSFPFTSSDTDAATPVISVVDPITALSSSEVVWDPTPGPWGAGQWVTEYTARYPAPSDVIWDKKVSTATNPKMIGSLSNHSFNRTTPATSIAPKGKLLIDLFCRGRPSRAELATSLGGISSLPFLDDRSRPAVAGTSNIQAMAAYSGRIFYAFNPSLRVADGDKFTPDIASFIGYSKTMLQESNFLELYQEGDPTSEDDSNVVDTDGGLLQVTGVGKVLKMVTMARSLFLFTDKGVWEISADEGVFSPTNYSVTKVSSLPVKHDQTIITLEDSVLFIQEGELKRLTIEPVSQHGKVEDESNNTVRDLFTRVTDAQWEASRSAYDPVLKRCMWMYKTTTTDRYKAIVYDMDYGVFRENDYAISTASNLVFTGLHYRHGAIQFITTYRPDSTYMRLSIHKEARREEIANNATVPFVDGSVAAWGVATSDPGSVLSTGFITGGAPSQEKRIGGHFTVFLNRTEDRLAPSTYVPYRQSDCSAQIMWDWHVNGNGKKWGPIQSAYALPSSGGVISSSGSYFYPNGDSMVKRKLRLRGRGQSLALRMTSSTGKDMHIYGVGLEMIANEKP